MGMSIVIAFLVLVLCIAALVDIVPRSDGDIQHLPKIVWVLLVIFFPLIGGILWFVVGRTYNSARSNGGGRYAEPFHRGDPVAQRAQASESRVSATEQELLDLDREIELHEKLARLRKLQAENGEGGAPVA
jgi:hypothetical protein